MDLSCSCTTQMSTTTKTKWKRKRQQQTSMPKRKRQKQTIRRACLQLLTCGEQNFFLALLSAFFCRLQIIWLLPFYANLRPLIYISASVVHSRFFELRNVRDCQKHFFSLAPSSYSYCLRLWSSLIATAPTKKRCRPKKESNKGHAQLLEA